MEDSPLCTLCIVQAVAMLVIANGAPVIVRSLLGERFAWPLDMGRRLGDGHALFGRTKTWRGFVVAVAATMAAAPWLGLSAAAGAWFGFWAMAGDLLSSFLKRRLGLAESSLARGLDVIPESLLPSLLSMGQIGLGAPDIAVVVGLFFLLEMWFSPLLHRLHIREKPY